MAANDSENNVVPNTSARLRNLDYDVVEQIIDILGQNDRGSLAACGLAGRVFLDRTRYQIFSTLRVNGNNVLRGLHGRAPDEVDNMFRDPSPPLTLPNPATYVRKLHLHIQPGQKPEHSHQMVAILERLTELQGVSVASDASWATWHSLPMSVTMCLTSVFARERITEVNLFGITQVPLGVLKTCGNVNQMELNSVNLTVGNGEHLGTQAIELHSLTYCPHRVRGFDSSPDKSKGFRQFISLLGGPNPILDLSQLRTLSLKQILRSDIEHVSRLFKICGPKLVNLVFDTDAVSSRQSSYALCNLEQLSCLQTLSLSFMFRPPAARSVAVIPGFQQAVSGLMPTIKSSALKRVTFKIDLLGFNPRFAPRLSLDDVDEMLIADALKDTQILFRISLRVSEGSSRQDTKSSISETFAQSLPKLFSSGRMMLEFATAKN